MFGRRGGNTRDFRRLQSSWERLGRGDPMRAVLTRPQQWEEGDFFSTGLQELASVMTYLDSLGVPDRRDRALDFGCGLGRVTGALAEHFERVVGVDVAASMIEGAERFHPGVSNIEFRHNPAPDLSCFESRSFDFVYSNITLQHMKPELAKGYIAEFVRIVSEDGLVLFQIPTSRIVPPRLPGLLRKLGHLLGRSMRMYSIPAHEVLDCLRSAGGRVIDVRFNRAAGPSFESHRYAVTPQHVASGSA